MLTDHVTDWLTYYKTTLHNRWTSRDFVLRPEQWKECKASQWERLYSAELWEFLEDMGLEFREVLIQENGNIRAFSLYGSGWHFICCPNICRHPECDIAEYPSVTLRTFYGEGKDEWHDHLGDWDDKRNNAPPLQTGEGYFPYGFRYMRYMLIFKWICAEMEKRGIAFPIYRVV